VTAARVHRGAALFIPVSRQLRAMMMFQIQEATLCFTDGSVVA
jgi:hypothetical protein